MVTSVTYEQLFTMLDAKRFDYMPRGVYEVWYEQNQHSAYYYVDSVEGEWNTGRVENPNLGYKTRVKEGDFPVPPTDTLQDLRAEMVIKMEEIGVAIEMLHHEVATGGQCAGKPRKMG